MLEWKSELDVYKRYPYENIQRVSYDG